MHDVLLLEVWLNGKRYLILPAGYEIEGRRLIDPAMAEGSDDE